MGILLLHGRENRITYSKRKEEEKKRQNKSERESPHNVTPWWDLKCLGESQRRNSPGLTSNGEEDDEETTTVKCPKGCNPHFG